MKSEDEKCKLCISLGGPHFPSLLKQVKAAAQWADLIEIRLDKLQFFDVNEIAQLVENAPCPFIWTLRKASQGGDFRGTEEERVHLLRTLFAKITPDFVDLEGDTPKEIIYELQNSFPLAQWIISWHDLNETPAQLDEIFAKISAFPATYYKIATFAQSTLDAIRMLKFTQKINQSGNRLCGLCMGEYGQSTRILSPCVGQPLTYATLEKGKETASGQLTAEELIGTYRFREINTHTQWFGLIGRPVDKSYSHLTHNAVLKKLSLNAIYLKFHIQDDELSPFFNEIQCLPFRGFSITMPFKEKILPFLQEPNDLAACNTLVYRPKGWQGYNTDGIGAVKALGFSSFKQHKVVIIGAGGTAQAIALALYQQGAELAILNRTIERAKKIATPLQAQWGALGELPALIQAGYDCIIQATSVGMAPAIEETPISADWIPNHATVLDVISNPPETRLLFEVKKRGGRAIGGRELFIHQAVAQFIHWFGSPIPEDVVERTIREHLPSLGTS